MKQRYDRYSRERTAKPVREMVTKVLDGHNLTEKVRVTRLHLEWRRLVGPRLAARTRPVGLRDGVLQVQVWDSPWLHTLSFMQQNVIDSINQRMGDPPMVTELHMKIGRFYPRNAVPDPNARPERQGPRTLRSIPEPASDQRAAEIAAQAECVEDPELRRMIVSLRCRWNV